MKEELVSKLERQEMAKRALKLDGTKSTMTTKIVDIAVEAERIKKERKKQGLSPYIQINPIQEDRFKETHQMFSVVKDPEYGVYYGIQVGKHADGNPVWKRIRIGEKYTLNLNREEDSMEWIIIRMHPKLQGSPFENDNAIYKVYDSEIEASKEIEKIDKAELAIFRAKKLKGYELLNYARYINKRVPEESSVKFIRSQVLSVAYNDPQKFNEMWEHKNKAFLEVLRSAKSCGVIGYNINQGFTYNQNTLGRNETQAIIFLEKNKDLADLIKNDVYKKDVINYDIPKEREDAEKAEDKARVKIGGIDPRKLENALLQNKEMREELERMKGEKENMAGKLRDIKEKNRQKRKEIKSKNQKNKTKNKEKDEDEL